MRTRFIPSLALLSMAISVPAQLEDGVYAIFDTSMGSFTCRLDYALAPRTVGNFVGLVEETQSWIDEATGQVRNEPFYDGTIVNRIADLPARIIQTGSRNGTNSGGGPGYTFEDEFHPALRHDKPGVISMANSGLNSNGSQYFFILDPTPHLNDVHSVFGEVIDGLNILTSIGNVTLSGIKPAVDVVFHTVRIERIGTAPLGFDSSAQGLPVVTEVESRLQSVDPGELKIMFGRRQHADYFVYSSSDLTTWSNILRDVHLSPPPDSPVVPVNATPAIQNFTSAEVLYPDPLFTPEDILGGRIQTTDTIQNLALDIQLDHTGSNGTIRIETGSSVLEGTITFTLWEPKPYSSHLVISYTQINLPYVDSTFVFTSPTTGFHKGNIRDHFFNAAIPLSADFQYTAPP